jgi:TRAP-type uncharacterized transport system substrate-binding protein
MSQPRIPNPRVENFIWINTKDEIRALILFLRHQWYLVIIAMAALAFLVSHFNPIPPSTIRLATGQPGSTLELIGKKYQERFKAHGVTIELVPSKGAADSLALLEAKKADAAISQNGLDIPKETGVVSLGSINYQPLWLFYKGPDTPQEDLFEFLKNKRVYVGVPGSGTRLVVDNLLKEAGRRDQPNFRPEGTIGAKESVEALLSGKLDAVFLVDGHEFGNAHVLLQNPSIKVVNFAIADALARRIGHIETVTLPRGGISLSPIQPSADIKMIATTTVLLVHDDLHHAIQNLFLMASEEIYKSERLFFDRPDGFPAFTDKRTPRSKIAENYYTNGAPFLADRAPYWLASFIDLAWFSLLTVLAVAYPLFRLVPSYRKYIFKIFASRLYAEIFQIEQTLYKSKSQEDLLRVRAQVESMNHKVRNVWVPKGVTEAYSFVIAAMEVLIQRANAQFAHYAIDAITAR